MVEFQKQKTYRDEAVVLRTQQLGESDRIVILLTRNYGVVHCVAKGIRKSSSRFGGRLEPFMYIDFALVAGKNLSTISQVTTKRAYSSALMGDYPAYVVATTMTEIVERISDQDAESSDQHFSLFLGAVSAIARNVHHPLDILASYLLRALHISGWGLNLDMCAVDGETHNLVWFSESQGLVCSNCVGKFDTGKLSKISEEMVFYFKQLTISRWEFLDSLQDEGLRSSALRLLIRFAEWQFEKQISAFSLVEGELLV